MAHFPVKFGWVRDALDPRDHVFSASLAQLQALPPKIDLLMSNPELFPPVYDQGRIGSCTANAIAAAIQFDRRKQKEAPDFVPSRLFIYYNERQIEHTIPLDSGAQLRDGMKSIAKLGVCPESDWTYDDTPADPKTNLFPPSAPDAQRPTSGAYAAAKDFRAISYSRINQNLAQMKGCLAAGYPFVVGFQVYDSIYGPDGRPKTVFPVPSTATDGYLGGHAVLAIGYDDATHLFKLRNSWGPDVQEQGYFYMPYAYLTDTSLSADFWTLRAMAE